MLIAAAVMLPHDVAAEQPPAPGARCSGVSLPLGSNLPLGTSSPDTDVVDVHVIASATGSELSGWYYSNRRADKFVQAAAGQEQYLSTLFTAAGATTAAVSITGNKPLSFIPISHRESVAFGRYAASRSFMRDCFVRPLAAHAVSSP
jgi:hypothetical protein